jgi:hypothetical protein
MTGFNLEGKLLERAWKPVFWLEDEAIFLSQRGETKAGECELSIFEFSFLALQLPKIYIKR